MDLLSEYLGDGVNAFNPNLMMQQIYQAIIISVVVLAILSLAFVVLYVIALINRLKADRAMIAMRNDVHEIRKLLESNSHTAVTQAEISSPLDDQTDSEKIIAA